MIILRKIAKLFSVGISNFQGEADTGIQDFIKIVAMGRKSPEDINHWADIVCSALINTAINRKAAPGLIRSDMYFFYGIGDSKFKSTLSPKIKVLKTEDYIKKRWEKVYTQKNSGGLKYSSLMSQHPSEEELAEIEDKLRYFAYRLSGQMTREDSWTDVYLTNEPINFSKCIFDGINPSSPGFKNLVKKEVLDIIKNLFFGETDILNHIK